METDRAIGWEYPTLLASGELELLESEAEPEGETGEVFSEADVAKLASRLLKVSDEVELDQLLGGTLSHAAQGEQDRAGCARTRGAQRGVVDGYPNVNLSQFPSMLVLT